MRGKPHGYERDWKGEVMALPGVFLEEKKCMAKPEQEPCHAQIENAVARCHHPVHLKFQLSHNDELLTSSYMKVSSVSILRCISMISIITPVLNEEKNIRPFLSHLDSLEGDFELILVDGGSNDRTLEEVQKWRDSFSHDLTILGTGRGRGTQMNKGADAALGDIFLFLHVDCSLEKDALTLIEKVIHEKKAIGGGFMQAFSIPDFFLKFQSAFGNLRAGMTGIFYGDFGIFLKSEVFRKIGGYEELPFLEEFELCRKAKRHGRLIQVDRRILTSPRRYLRKGKLRLTIAFMLANLFNVIRRRPMFLWKYIVEM